MKFNDEKDLFKYSIGRILQEYHDINEESKINDTAFNQGQQLAFYKVLTMIQSDIVLFNPCEQNEEGTVLSDYGIDFDFDKDKI